MSSKFRVLLSRFNLFTTMQNIFRLPILLIVLLASSCQNSGSLSERQDKITANEVIVSKLINSFDATLKQAKELKNAKISISEDRLKEMFLSHLVNQGLVTLPNTPIAYSNVYLSYVTNIASANNFTSADDFINYLQNLQIQAVSVLSNKSELQDFLDKSEFMVQLIIWMENNQELFGYEKKCSGWWSCWGKCVAGIAGGAITGGLGGAAVGSVVPVLGTGWGAALGAIGGGLTGAATFCD